MSITLIAVRNPQWKTIKTERLDDDGNVVNDSDGNPIMDILNDADGNPVKVIDCECQWSHLGDNTQEWLPFTATNTDVAQHGKDLYDAIVAGEHGEIALENA
jgi:5-hydroxyisourate hydrolase-like protein (transthyretin family)